MTVSEALLTAIVALLAAIIGGFIQARLSQSFERERYVKQQRVEAYLMYMQGISKLSHAETPDEAAIAHAMIAESRGRIALFGGNDTVASLAQVFRHRGDIHSEAAWPDFARMLQSMREDCVASGQSDDRTIFEVVYGSGPRKEID